MDERNNKEVQTYNEHFIDSNIKQIDEILPELNKLKSQVNIVSKGLNEISLNIVDIEYSINFMKKNSNMINREKNVKFKKTICNMLLNKFNEFQKNNEIIINKFIEFRHMYNNIKYINNLCMPSLENESLSSSKVEKKINLESNSYNLNNNFKNSNNINPTFVDKNSEKLYLNINDNEEKKEYLKCLKCKKNAENMYKNNYYCKTCYHNFLSNHNIEDVFNEKDIILDKNNPINIKNEKK